MKTETIAAISTAMNNSGIGIIRISGDDAFSIIKNIFRPANSNKRIDEAQSHTVHYGTIQDGEVIVDEVLVLIMKGPHTYTRENTVEIDCHGGMYVMNKVMELVLREGARTAEPGEFTKRAFLNGRIDLSQAEAVIDVINAENDFALQSAVTQLKGSVSDRIRRLRAVLLEQIAYIEAALDDPEHMEIDGYGKMLLPIVQGCSSRIRELVRTADDGRILKEGIRTVILGKPNVGKSSLLNALVGSDRAIVTQIPGTTRDALEETIRMGEITLHMMDTAGIRDTQDVIEKIGVEKSLEYAARADLILWVVDGARELDEDDQEILEIIRNKKTILLLNKQDLSPVVDLSELKQAFGEEVSFCTPEEMEHLRQTDSVDAEMDRSRKEPSYPANLTDPCQSVCQENSRKIDQREDRQNRIPVIGISALRETGLEDLKQTLLYMFYNRDINFNDQVYITNIRQKESLIAADHSLQKTMDSIESGMPEDFYTIDLMDAYASLGKVIGESVEDDLADEIFAKFCMGK